MSAMDMQAFMNAINGANAPKQSTEKNTDTSSEEIEKNPEDETNNSEEYSSSQTSDESDNDETIEDAEDIIADLEQALAQV